MATFKLFPIDDFSRTVASSAPSIRIRTQDRSIQLSAGAVKALGNPTHLQCLSDGNGRIALRAVPAGFEHSRKISESLPKIGCTAFLRETGIVRGGSVPAAMVDGLLVADVSSLQAAE